jgi:S-adenosylmethionine synthetase
MFGYACNETEHLMPLPITIAHELVQLHAQLRKSNTLPFLLPDAKSQVTVRYIDDVPFSVEKVVLSTQHKEGFSQKEIRDAVIEHIVRPVLSKYFEAANPEILINPSGSFTIGGPKGDAGLTGRKIIVDTYGGSCPHGGGAFSGKDPSKVDRTGAYIARNVAKHVVAAGLASRCTVQVSYAIGLAQPVSTYVNTHGTGKISDNEIAQRISKIFDFTPNSAIEQFNLKSPIYRKTAAYGHFGRPEFTWEKINPTYIDILNGVK